MVPTPSMTPLLSVVIPTYHRNDSLAQILKALTPGMQTLSADQYEVIVSDAGTHSTAENLICKEFPWAKWVAAPGCNPGLNRNAGAAQARGVWLVFLDDDCRIGAEFLQGYYAKAASGAFDVLEGKLTCLEKTNTGFRRQPENLNGGLLFTASIAIRREVFFRIGPFDADLRMAEDMELAYRLKVSGQRIGFCPEAIADHPSQKLSLRFMLKWQFQRHWYLLYRYKIGVAAPLDQSDISTLISLLQQEITYVLRTVFHLFTRHDPAAWRHNWFGNAAWVFLLSPLVIPCSLFWGLRYRLLIRSGKIKIRPLPAMDRGC